MRRENACGLPRLRRGRAGGVSRCPRAVESTVENVNGRETVDCCRRCVRFLGAMRGVVVRRVGGAS